MHIFGGRTVDSGTVQAVVDPERPAAFGRADGLGVGGPREQVRRRRGARQEGRPNGPGARRFPSRPRQTGRRGRRPRSRSAEPEARRAGRARLRGAAPRRRRPAEPIAAPPLGSGHAPRRHGPARRRTARRVAPPLPESETRLSGPGHARRRPSRRPLRGPGKPRFRDVESVSFLRQDGQAHGDRVSSNLRIHRQDGDPREALRHPVHLGRWPASLQDRPDALGGRAPLDALQARLAARTLENVHAKHPRQEFGP